MIVAILEDNARAWRRWEKGSQPSPQTRCVVSNSAGGIIAWLRENWPSVALVSLDHDLDYLPGPDGRLLDPGDGRVVADFLASHPPACPVVIHTSNALAGEGMEFVLREAGWTVKKVYPQDFLKWTADQWLPLVLHS